MIKKIVCLIGIVTACLANAMSQEDIAEKVDRTDMVLRQTHYKAVNVTGAQAPREKMIMTLYHNPALAGVAGKSRYRAEAYYDDDSNAVWKLGRISISKRLRYCIRYIRRASKDVSNIIPNTAIL